MVADFGIAEMFNAQEMPLERSVSGQSHSLCPLPLFTKVGGSAHYMAPEVFRGEFSFTADVWSVGVILFELLLGDVPYKAENIMAVYAVNRTVQFSSIPLTPARKSNF
jgi:serine/threonine protein kinase